METSLNFEWSANGITLTFPDGRDAGKVLFDTGRNGFVFVHPEDAKPPYATSPLRNCSEASKFDALAWAAEENNKCAT